MLEEHAPGERFVQNPTPPIGYGFTEWWVWSGWRGRDRTEILLERIGADRSTHSTGGGRYTAMPAAGAESAFGGYNQA